MNKEKDLIIFSNGPGEVSTWVLPVIDAVQKRSDLADHYRVILIIHPCQFGSGTEHRVAKHFPGIEYVIMPCEYVRILIFGMKKKYDFNKEGLIFSLGGDLMHPVLFRRRIKGRHTLYAYTNNTGWEKHYEKIFVRNEYVKNKFLQRNVPARKIIMTGDLVYSSLKLLNKRHEVRKFAGLLKDERMIAFMPGSREFEVKYMVPVFLKVIDDLTRKVQGLKSFILKSPYISYDLFKKALSYGGKIKEAESIPGTLKQSSNGCGYSVEYSGGQTVRILDGGLDYWGNGIDFAVTLPGTNTIQLAYRKIPALVVAPMNKPEVIPVEGAIGLLKWVPWIGKFILKKAAVHYSKKFLFASLPNIYSNEEVLPELFGVIRTEDITEKVIDIFERGEEKEIKKRLSILEMKHDPAEILLKEVWGEQ